MAPTQKKQMWLWSTDDGVAPITVKLPIAASQGILMPGAPVYISQAGTVKVCDSSDGSDAWHGFLVGTADRGTTWPLTAALAGSVDVIVQLIAPADTYAVYVDTGGTDAASTQAMVGDQYGLTVQTSPAGLISYTTLTTGNTNATVQVTNVIWEVEPSKHAAADSPGIALVKFLTAVVEASKA